MKIEDLASNVYKNHLQIQSQLAKIFQIKERIRESRIENLKSQWLARNRRYLTEKLNQNFKEHIELIDTLNNDKSFRFDKASLCPKFGCTGESSITELFQYLRDNPRLVAYLIFHTENEKSSFLELFTKICISSIYSHCCYENDRNGVVQILNELIDIYINFHSVKFRSQIYHKNSAFIVTFQSFCSVLPEVKTFFNLTLRQAVMQVLTEDTFYLDINPNNACMRFKPDDRKKHFGEENGNQLNEKMVIYKEWTIKRLKFFVDLFISHLRCNIFSFPKSLATIFVRLYSKMIQMMDFEEVRTTFLDLLFSFLICPVIQNPDLCGLVDFHIDSIGKYNLQQCALIIQHLALSQSNQEYSLVCDLFDKDSLAFVIDHILGIFNNHEQAQVSPKFDNLSENIPCFLISEFELKLLLEYLRLFIQTNNNCSEEFKKIYHKIPKQCFNFDCPRAEPKNFQNSLKIPNALRKQRSQETISDQSESEFIFEYAFRQKNISNILQHYKPLMFSRNVFQFFVYDNQEFDVLSSKTFYLQFKNSSEEFNSSIVLFDHLKQKYRLEYIRKNRNNLQTFESPEKLLLLDLDTQLNVDLNGPFGTKTLVADDFSEIENKNDEKLIDYQTDDYSDFITSNAPNQNNTKPSSRPLSSSSSSSSSGRQSGKTFFNLNLRNIKEKVKSISIKDSVSVSTNRNVPTENCLTGNSLDGFVFNANTETVISTDIQTNHFKLEEIQDKTDEILSKYRNNFNKIHSQEKLLDLDDFFPENDNSNSNTAETEKNLKSKLYKLFSLINFSSILDGFEFLKLEDKNHFVMFLKVLLSEAQIDHSLREIILITDIINSLKAMTNKDFNNSVLAIYDDLKLSTFYSVYLFKCQEYLLDYQSKIDKIKDRFSSIQRETNYKVVTFLTGKVFDDHEKRLEKPSIRINDISVPLDEKIETVKSLMKEMLQSNELSVLTPEQSSIAKLHIERHLISCFYLQLFFANGDIDRMRDQIMHQQIDKLSQTITPSSKLLKIPQQYQSSSPWPSAQRELQLMFIYKTAHEKIQCIERCCKHIITLLDVSDSNVPAADDLLPVLIFVVIKANPMSLLSTIQYVNAFFSDELFGESAYYWTQFCSVVEFIKTVIHQTD